MTATQSEHKLKAKQKQIASPVVGQTIAYITQGATSEVDIVIGPLRSLFGRGVYPYPWEDPDEIKKHLPETDPCCVIISQPLECDQGSMWEMWSMVRKIFPAVPVLWLAPLDDNLPHFLPTVRQNRVRLLVTELGIEVYEELVRAISELTGIKLPDNLKL